MTTADRLNDLITAKEDMKSAIEEKGVEVTGGLITYADLIRMIDASGGIDFSRIGYSETFSEQINNNIDIELSKSENILSTWDPNYEYGLYPFTRDIVFAPLIDTSNVSNMNGFFQGCHKLLTVPMLNTSNASNMQNMFDGCQSLTSVPLFDTSKVTNMGDIFNGCYSLTTVPLFDTSKVTNMIRMFYNCTYLNSVPLLDCSSVVNVTYMFRYCYNTNLMLDGLKNLGMTDNITGTSTMFYNTLYHINTNAKQSIINVINNLYDRASSNYAIKEITIGAAVLNTLSEDEIAIATNKGWIISGYLIGNDNEIIL